jgi:hypothetical protein
MGKIACSNEMVHLTKRVSKFTSQKFQRVGSCVRSVEALGKLARFILLSKFSKKFKLNPFLLLFFYKEPILIKKNEKY